MRLTSEASEYEFLMTSRSFCLLTKSPSSRLMKPLTSPDSSSLDGICEFNGCMRGCFGLVGHRLTLDGRVRSEEHTSELQSLAYLVCRLLLEKKKYTERQA